MVVVAVVPVVVDCVVVEVVRSGMQYLMGMQVL